jgi:hypothetical protein
MFDCLWIRWLRLSNSCAENLSLMWGNSPWKPIQPFGYHSETSYSIGFWHPWIFE